MPNNICVHYKKSTQNYTKRWRQHRAISITADTVDTLDTVDTVDRASGLHKLWYPSIRDTRTWSKFGAHGEHGDVFLFSNLGAL